MNEKQIEKVARAMAIGMRRDPDQMVPATGYPDAEIIPYWTMQREWAIRWIAAHEVMKGEQ